MNKIFFYKDKKGNEPVYDYMQSLSKKKTNKTPRREIEKAKQELQDFRERGEQDE